MGFSMPYGLDEIDNVNSVKSNNVHSLPMTEIISLLFSEPERCLCGDPKVHEERIRENSASHRI